MNPRELGHDDAFAELVQTVPFVLREDAVKRETFVAVVRQDYPAGRKLHSLLAGRICPRVKPVRLWTASGREWHGNSGQTVVPNERMDVATKNGVVAPQHLTG